MKICPTCQTRYTDDTLQFCLQDGATLESEDSQSSEPKWLVPNFAEIRYSEPETVIRNRPTDKIEFDLRDSKQTQDWEQQKTASGSASSQTETKRSNTALAVVTTILAMLLIFGIGIALWLYFGNKENEIANNTAVNSTFSNTEKENPTTNLNINSAASPSPKNSEKPTPKPTQIPPSEAEEIKQAVNKTIFDWKWLAEGRRLDGHMEYYADRIDYYNKKGASINTVRADKEKAFTIYDRIKINLSNVNITPDNTGEKATAVFDKQWFFESEEKDSEGKVQSQLQLEKIDGKWKITGEKDLKVYYTK